MPLAYGKIASEREYIIDLHCAGNPYPYILALYKSFKHVKDFVTNIPHEIVIESTGLRGQLFVELSHTGKRSVIIECLTVKGMSILFVVTSFVT